MARIDFSFQKRHEGKFPFLLEAVGQVKSNSLIGIFGSSGSGKTTFLRCLAGLSHPDTGVIKFDGNLWYDKRQKINKTVQDRKVGFVFQEPSLFPNMTVQENIEFAHSKAKFKTLDEDLNFLKLTHLLSKYPRELSGGEKQRVALLRTISNEPQLLLLDEPLSALDIENEFLVINYIKKIHRERQLCTLMVSHDPQKLAIIADEIWEFEKGKIKKTYTVKDLQNKFNTIDLFKEKGIILSIESKNNVCRLGILYNDTLIYTQLDPRLYPNIKCGDAIQLSHLNISS